MNTSNSRNIQIFFDGAQHNVFALGVGIKEGGGGGGTTAPLKTHFPLAQKS